VPIQACLDEAGVQNTDEVFVLAGFLNPSDQWHDFSEDWHRCMSDSPAISQFHMLEAASLSGQFKNWHRETRDAKLRSLVEVAKKHDYVTWEHHYGENVLITRKGAVRAREGDMGIYSRQHGRAFVHRARQGQSGKLHEL